MPQEVEKVFPVFINLDTAYEKLSASESPFIKDMGYDINTNPNSGTQNPSGEGQNFQVLSPNRSNKLIPNNLPAGYNLNVGNFYSEVTNECYYLNFNINGNHGIYVIAGATLTWQTVIIDPNLNFTDDPKAFAANHRFSLRVVYDKNKNVIEKFLMWTNGANWQNFISVLAAIGSNGFNASLFPYWALQPPQFDRRELLELATRPPMIKPIATPIPNTAADATKINSIIDTSFQFAIACQNTDGRPTTFGTYSDPAIVQSQDYLSSPDELPKNISLTLPAGSPLTEKILIYVRYNDKGANTDASVIEWSDWYLYDIIYKYSECGSDGQTVLGTSYWLRKNPWGNYNYDPVQNTIIYNFDNSNQYQIISNQPGDIQIQTDMPQLSTAITDAGNALLLTNNRTDYDNFGCDVLDNISAQVIEKEPNFCPLPLRTIALYCYIGRCGEDFSYRSQVGYHVGTDTQYYFGSLASSAGALASFDITESKFFDLTFADRKAPICYLKGTPYYSVGQLYQVQSDQSMALVTTDMDFGNNDVLTFVNSVFNQGGYFIYKFLFTVPAGRYIASMGRHNVDTTGDYRNTSTYVEGIANSRVTTTVVYPQGVLITVQPNAIQTFSKEIQADCVNQNVDVWGNGGDLFYVYCPYNKVKGNGEFKFVEGYLQESATDPIGVELFPYELNSHATDDWGRFTDKNGFYFAFTKVEHSNIANIFFTVKLNCVYPVGFQIPSSKQSIGWSPNGPAYLSDHNLGNVGGCNRILLNGTVRSLDNTIGYSDVSVSIVDGATTMTDENGNFTLIIHNGQPTLRTSNVYVNSAGSYIITIAACGYIPINVFSEANAPCFNCNVRVYPYVFNYNVVIQTTSQTSLKQNAKYGVGFKIADLAGRYSFVNPIVSISVPSFITRQDTLATFFRMFFTGIVNFWDTNRDAAWFIPMVTKELTESFYVEWVGDSISYIDNTGNVVTDPASAVYVSIAIDSLFNYNVIRNFSILASYQFQQGDRIRFYDDGKGNLLTGSLIDLQILGTSYNQAAMNANLIPTNSTVPVVNIDNTVNNQTTVNNSGGQTTNTVTAATVQNQTSITLYVLFDPRLAQLFTDTGFWIELARPAKLSEVVPYLDGGLVYPIINGQIAIYSGNINGRPQYTYPSQIDLSFWDTYLFSRSITIPNVGDKFLNHPFESPNISDSWGADITSGGKVGVKNDNARQTWYVSQTIKSDDYINQAVLNGLSTFRSRNIKNFNDFKAGGIVATKSLRNLIAFICENDFFITDYSFQYIFANAQGIQVANLDDNLGTPHQKVGDNYGVAYEHSKTVLFFDKWVTWFDYKNYAWVICEWRQAKDISRNMFKSYLYAKTNFIEGWNNTAMNNRIFDVAMGVDAVRDNLYLTFRPRRNNSNNVYSYINNRRNIQVDYQETFVYNLDSNRLVRFTGFTPESYSMLKGETSGLEMISFAAGSPYIHNNTGNESFSNYYGVQCTPMFIPVFNKNSEIETVLQNVSIDGNPHGMYVDLIFSEEENSFSYIPENFFKKAENQYYAASLRNMVSYPPIDPKQLYRSMLQDGKRNFGRYFVCRFIANKKTLGEYFEVKGIYYQQVPSENIKK